MYSGAVTGRSGVARGVFLAVTGLVLAGCGSSQLWPTIERRVTGDRGFHHLLDRPRDRPWRTATVSAFITWVAVVFLAGSADRIYVLFSIPYETLIWIFRVLVFLLPVVVFRQVARGRGAPRALRPRRGRSPAFASEGTRSHVR